MADTDKKTKNKSDKTRILVLFAFLLVLIVGIIFAYMGLKKHHKEKELSAATLRAAPDIESIPGLDSATQEYVKTQQKENLLNAEAAAKEGTAAVPTITRPSFRNDSSDFVADAKTPTRPGCTAEDVKRARLAGVSAAELRCKGCSVKDLHGFFTAAELKQAGFSAAELKASGFSVAELKEAGFNTKELLDAKFSSAELKDAGYTVADLKAAGVSLEEMRNFAFSPEERRDAGFTAAEMKAAGTGVEDLKKAGFSAKELKEAGVSVQDLIHAGFSAEDLIAAGATDEELAAAGFSPQQIKEMRAKLAAKAALPKDCSVAALSKAKNEGLSAAALGALKCDAAALKAAGYTAEQLKAAGFNAKDLKAAGFTAAELKAAGYTAGDLKAAGLTAKELKAAGFTTADLKAVGVTAAELKQAGYTANELKDGGFTAAELRQAGYDAVDLLKAGVNPSELRAAGFSVEQLKAAGISPTDLKGAGFTDGELVRAGFTAEDINQSLLKADPAKLRAGGYGAVQLKTAGFSADKLRAAGYTAAELLAAGYSAEDLKKAGFSDDDLLKAGVSQQEIDRVKAPVASSRATSSAESANIPDAEKQKSSSSISAVPGSSDVNDPEKLLARLQKQQAERISGEQQAEMLQQIQTGMTTQANELFGSWNPPAQQQYVVGEKDEKETGAASGSGAATSAGGKGGNAESKAAPSNLVKAGSVMFAVLDTGINSDEISPILATIVHGPLKGAKLLGQFARTDKKVVLSFTTMSLPQLPTSIPVNLVAIDPDTARTAMAGSVNSHYLLRYGTLFASAFLTGFSNAVAQSGSQIVPPATTGGSAIITQPALTTNDKIAMALGQVGTQYSAEMGKNFSTPPTVKVEGGAALGILFMTDLALPKEVPLTP
jgi:intracellular multiplication protein IcmE